MKFCVVGAGSIGGYFGVKLAAAGEDITLIARGANLEAIRARGMRLTMADGTDYIAPGIKATASLAEAGPHDVVILGMKAHQVAPVVNDLHHLLHDETVIVPMQNGIPWCYFQRHGGAFEGRRVAAVDPDGAIMNAIDPARIIGCVVYPACELVAPGVVRHIEGDRFPLGEPDGSESTRVRDSPKRSCAPGSRRPCSPASAPRSGSSSGGNLTFNPISALTHSTLVDICQFAPTRELAAAMMREAEQVANKLGVGFRVTLEKRIAGAEKVGKHKTSMLQDVEAGRDPEIDALVGAVIELGHLTGVPTPHIDAAYALVKLLGRTMQEERVSIRAQPFG